MERKPEIPGENAGIGTEEEGEERFPAEENASGSWKKSGDEDISGGETADGDRPEGSVAGRDPTRSRTVLLVGAVLLFLFLAAGFFFLHFTRSANNTKRLEPVTSIIRPIPQPDYRDMLDFLLVYQVEGQETITAIRMEVEFQSSARYRDFKERNVVFRDTVYNFLLKQNAAGNSAKSWHSVLGKNLIDYLRIKLPGSYPDKIILTQVENL